MRFSVIIPLYNKAPYIAKAIDSVLAQTFTDYELVIVDDGSRDESARIASDAISGHENCRLIKQENAGVSVARNNGVKASQGDYLCFLDADDWWEPMFLEEMSRLVVALPDAGIYGTNYTIVNETKHKTRVAQIGVEQGFEHGYINYCQVYAKTMYMPLWTGAVCIPRRVFEEMIGFPEGIKLGEDFLLWLCIALKYQVAFLNKALSNYNQDVELDNRGVKDKGFDPESFMTFHFDQFEDDERKNPDLKILLDRIRVYSLLRFWSENAFRQRVKEEICKVDFRNVEDVYRFYYTVPYPLAWICLKVQEILRKTKDALR